MPPIRMTRTESLALKPVDMSEMNGLRLRAADFFSEVGDGPPTVETLESDLADLPEGRTRAYEVIHRAYEGDVLVGYAEVLRGWPDAESWVIGLLLVDASRRSAGIGHGIVEVIASEARTMGVRTLLVGVISSRERSLAFWTREGFGREVLRRTLVIGPTEHEIIRLAKDL